MASQYKDLPLNDGTAGAVISFNTRTGAVTPQAGDYTASQITNVPAGNISATDVQAAINELDSEKQTRRLNFVTKTANYNIAITDDIIYIDTSGSAFTLTLPDPSTASTSTTTLLFRIIDVGGAMNTNNLTLAPFGAEKIEGLAASKLLQTDWGSFTVTSNNTDWFVG